MRKTWAIFLIVSILVFLAYNRISFGKEQEVSNTELQQKLEQLLQNQDKILEELEYLHEQIDIVRVRSSRR